VGAYSTLKAFHVERNRVFVLLKLFPARLVAMSPAYTAWRLALHLYAALTGRGAAGRLARQRSAAHLPAVILRAYASALRSSGGMLRSRRELAPLRRLSTEGFVRLLREFRLTAREAALKD
jgi:hypothetical protein